MPCACAGPRRLCTRTPACGSGTGCSGAGGHGGLLSGALPFADGGEAGGPGGLSRRGAGGFRWEAAVSREDGRAVFTGWACVEGEPFPDVDIRVVLYHAEDGAYYSIPTQMTPDEAATAAVADGRGYALGGFTAVVPEKVLAHPLAEYEICIAYRVGGFDFLASTGKTAEVTG